MVSLPCVVTHFLSESQCLDGIQLFLPTLNYYRVPISYYRVVHAVHALLAVYCLLADFIVWFPLSLSPTFFHRQFHNSVVLTGAWWIVSGLPGDLLIAEEIAALPLCYWHLTFNISIGLMFK